MPSTNYAYVNGRFVPESAAVVSIDDPGFLHGDGVFETMRVYAGRVFRAYEHMERLSAGLRFLGITCFLSPEELRAATRALIQRNDIASGVARVYVSRGSLVITVRPAAFGKRTFTARVTSIRLEAPLSRYKTANRLPYRLALREAQAAGANEGVLLNPRGEIVEFANANLFLVAHGELVTPSLASGPLPGIARQVTIELAHELGLPLRESAFGPDQLEGADEVFATNSLVEIAPVTNWSRRSTWTARLQAAYRQRVQAELSD